MNRGTGARVSSRNCQSEFHLSGKLLLRIIVSFCHITGTFCNREERMPRGTNDMQIPLSRATQLGHCDFEKSCDWFWDQNPGFERTKAPVRGRLGPITDASNSERGHFLWFTGGGKTQMWSLTIPPTGSLCVLELSSYQVEMKNGYINLVIITNNTSSIAAEKPGNNYAKWGATRFKLGTISQPHKLLLEMLLPNSNSSIAIDNIRLIDCFPESTPLGTACTKDMFRCNNGSCLNRTRVCDLTKDCADGEDEERDCDKIPENARCDFEHGWCGWRNVPGRPLNWTLHRGATPSEKTGPSYDHTYRNASGTYAYVNMSKRVEYGSRGTIESPLYNPTPPYSSDIKSPYYGSCQVRFFFHQYGVHSGSLALYLIQVKPHQNHSESLWWSYGDRSDVWYNHAVSLPDIRYRYFLEFEASRGYSSKGDVAIDDFSLSPECFGIGVPPEVVGNFNYYNPVIDSEKIPDQHADFVNETVIRIGTCGATGRTGPTPDQCADEYNKTGIELILPPPEMEDPFSFNLNGVQRWTAPRGGYYTLIGMGARGGKGSSGMGSTLGALVRGVIELEKGEQLYFMVGQPGTDACPKNLGLRINSCQGNGSVGVSLSPGSSSKVYDVRNIRIRDGGGGGGGATYIFTLKNYQEQHPVLIAAGGGGIGLGQFIDNGLQHGRGPAPLGRQPTSGIALSIEAGGPGGGWNGSSNTPPGQRTSAGTSLVWGGVGGIGCGPGNHSHGNGGFGGGGGGCLTGGGGGGYIGGDTGRKKPSNGEGGYSYASRELMHVHFRPGINHGPGEVYIIPAISGCGCDFRCVALDQYLSETKCLCPPGWLLSNDSRSCVMADDSKITHQTFMIWLIAMSVGLFLAFAALCLLLYNRYQNKKALLRRRQVMFGNGTELTSLHGVSDTMMTEFNPNYEFAGNLYSFKDLPQIPRDYITLVKPLGQGAFGEVFQGVYKYRRNEEHPVAVKTIPCSSRPETEADFMMEALIMSKFNHPNIVHFIGVSFDKNPKYIVLELLAGGNLKNFLREERPRADRSTSLTMLDLIMCGYDVAKGCKYMEEARFIHRDIAARNCLLTCKGPGRIVKIADFGMAKDIYRSDYYRKGGKAMLPIKWMPPESFLDGIFTTKTDVWAFGVLLWEIMSFGYIPYTGCTNREAMSMVTSGGRLEKPAGCPDPIYGIMTRCWHPHPEDRPSFATIVERMGYCLQDPDVINHPTPNFDILPICDREITIMRPDPETECINVQSELDACGYMQPRIIDPRSASQRMAQAAAGNPPISGNENPSKILQSTDRLQPRFLYNPYGSSADTSKQTCDGNTTHNDNENDHTENKQKNGSSTPEEQSVHRTSMDIENSGKLRNADNGNNRPAKTESRRSSTIDVTDADRRNGNDSVTDTNSDSLIVASSDTPPDTTNSSPNTRTCSPSHTGLNTSTNVNGMLKKNALKAALSLDPSALCRGTIPYEKIAFSPPPQRSSTPGSMELKKDPLGHELPREEECSC
ncbi:anaplastic lymphoma kinase isoform X1 [Osmia lignaria lignaria]|uniref:anaplastic lymphoma kinase isoform X1 n=1 Tax=Osmia lignaria lignaria TaxID=1437193 RepID=UPI00147911C7|nr:leukocyte tyrosine kinase receptor isoform X1 [Osmia lignaria]XP_034171880.1 leukocyte tyrosine kinase receptor isoform X1 [Osmia lignaria]XP_034171881.1 leukocyte tyrosine kinase receptor isoform X1 [Osmia lignaria]XP_034171882.1 leukocyte tyrosine kinase receptor isoform X1 [Osmia lignaria]XP_034171883.1 leukocyte tyrosine kinase receptor isoform X1 [Osmia lignaria]